MPVHRYRRCENEVTDAGTITSPKYVDSTQQVVRVVEYGNVMRQSLGSVGRKMVDNVRLELLKQRIEVVGDRAALKFCAMRDIRHKTTG